MKTCPTCNESFSSDLSFCPIHGAALMETEGWAEGTLIWDTYRVLGKLGQTWMTALYRARDLRFETLCVLEVMLPEFAGDAELVECFKQQGRSMARMIHPNVVRVDALGKSADGYPFMVMEFIKGRKLRKVIRQEAPLEARRVCDIARQMAAGLEAAHGVGALHGKLTPETVFYTEGRREEEIKLAGFGQYALEAAWSLRCNDPEVDPPFNPYLSPEHATGGALDGRADLYSLGLIMYELLTRELPFVAENTADWLMELSQPLRPIQSAQHGHTILPSLAKLVMRCLERDRNLRPASARELIGEIQRAEEEIELWKKSMPCPHERA
jgi:serine/threonine-protein kinase